MGGTWFCLSHLLMWKLNTKEILLSEILSVFSQPLCIFFNTIGMKGKFYLYLRNEKRSCHLLISGDILYLFRKMKCVFVLEPICKSSSFNTGGGRPGCGWGLGGGGKREEEEPTTAVRFIHSGRSVFLFYPKLMAGWLENKPWVDGAEAICCILFSKPRDNQRLISSLGWPNFWVESELRM